MTKTNLRSKLAFCESDFIIVYIAEFIPRKNHEFLLRSIGELRKKIPELKILLAGSGALLKKMKHLAVDLEIDGIVKFLGYRKDVADLCHAGDVYVSVSFQEGLPVSVIEAMSCGLPVVASDIRGHRDCVEDGENGFLFALENDKGLRGGIFALYKSVELRERFSKKSADLAKKYDLNEIRKKMDEIYEAEIKR